MLLALSVMLLASCNVLKSNDLQVPPNAVVYPLGAHGSFVSDPCPAQHKTSIQNLKAFNKALIEAPTKSETDSIHLN